MSVAFDIDRSELDAALAKVVQTATSLPAGMAKAAYALQGLIQNTFRTQSDPWGAPWPEQAASTLARKAKLGQGSAREIATGDMISSLESSSGPDFAQAQMGDGFEPPYPSFQQFGVPGKLEASPMFPLDSNGMPDFPDHWLQVILQPICDDFAAQLA